MRISPHSCILLISSNEKNTDYDVHLKRLNYLATNNEIIMALTTTKLSRTNDEISRD